jgi:WD40 repeat protein
MEAAGGGRWLSITTDSEVGLWNPAALAPAPFVRESCRRGGRVGAATVNPQGTSLALACDPHVQLTDLRSNPRPPSFVYWASRGLGFSPLTLHLNDKVLIVVGKIESSAFTLAEDGEPSRFKDGLLCGTGRRVVSPDASAIATMGASESPMKEYRVCRQQQDDFKTYYFGNPTRINAPRLDVDRPAQRSELFDRGPVFSGDGNYIAIPSLANVRVFESSSGKPVAVVHRRPDMSAVLLSFDGALVMLVMADGEVQTWATRPFDPVSLANGRLWAAETRSLQGTFHDGRIQSLKERDFPYGATRVTCERSTDKLKCNRDGALWDSLDLVDLGYGPELGWVGLERSGQEFRAIRLQPRGELCQWTDQSGYRLSSDGKLAVSTDGRFRVLDLMDQGRPRPIGSGIKLTEIQAVFSAPDGPILVLRSQSCTIRLVRMATGEHLGSTDECAWAVALSHDGRWLVTAGDGEVRVHDRRSSKVIARRSGIPGYPQLGMSTDARQVLIYSEGRIETWRWQFDDLRREVCGALERNLAAAQFRDRLSRDELASACTAAPRNPSGQK